MKKLILSALCLSLVSSCALFPQKWQKVPRSDWTPELLDSGVTVVYRYAEKNAMIFLTVQMGLVDINAAADSFTKEMKDGGMALSDFYRSPDGKRVSFRFGKGGMNGKMTIWLQETLTAGAWGVWPVAYDSEMVRDFDAITYRVNVE